MLESFAALLPEVLGKTDLNVGDTGVKPSFLKAVYVFGGIIPMSENYDKDNCFFREP